MFKIPYLISAFILLPLVSSFGVTPIFVSNGDFTSPPYRFYSDQALTTELFIGTGGADALSITETYSFSGGSGFHPFYISDQPFSNPIGIILDGDGSSGSGITGFSQSFTLSFDSFDPGSDTLTYFCTTHSSMTGTFNVIPEPSTYALFGGALALALVMVRRRFRG